MAQFTWTFDTPSGPVKTHKISRTVYRAAIAKTVFMDHVKVKPALGRNSGETVTLLRTSAMTEQQDYDLVETVDIPERAFAMSTIGITVREVGSAVPYTLLSSELDTMDVEGQIRENLSDEESLMLDTKAAAAMKLGRIKFAVTGATTQSITTNGVFGATSTANMNVAQVKVIKDYLYATLKAKPAEGGDYVGIFNHQSIRGLMDDPTWEEWHKYTDPTAMFNAEVGRIEQVRFIDTNHDRAAARVGTGGVLGEGFVFGKEAIAFALAKELGTYVTPPQGHAGRFRAISWYGIIGFRMIWEDSANPGEANSVHVGSL
jgi:N4-gp56 family major capsid protein